jgi:CRP/FNR family transcriptional regulator, anaerobic regulatory protein
MEELLGYLDSIYPLSAAVRSHLTRVVKAKEIRARQFILTPGQVNQDIHFIKKGLLWCYYLKNEKEVTSWLMKEGDAIVSIDSFYGQVPGYEYIQALEDSELYYISYTELEEIYHSYPEFNFIGRVLTVKYLQLWSSRQFGMVMSSAEERYAYLLEKQPELVLRAPLKCLASYLGMTEGTLSRIRGRR